MQSRDENASAASRLMAVDDEFDITFTLKKILEQSGFSLDIYNDPTTALSNYKPDYYETEPGLISSKAFKNPHFWI